jgi:hypothetical protein
MFRAASEPETQQTPAEGDFIGLLERMTPEERLRSSRREFTTRQRAAWASRYPEEVPLVNGEFEWIALASADLD